MRRLQAIIGMSFDSRFVSLTKLESFTATATSSSLSARMEEEVEKPLGLIYYFPSYRDNVKTYVGAKYSRRRLFYETSREW